MEIRSVAVLGAGTMGSGIAQVFAGRGYTVLLSDVSMKAAEGGVAAVRRGLERLMKKGVLGEDDSRNILRRVTPVVGIDDQMAGVDLAIEAVTEREEVKADVLRKLEAILNPSAVIASNTSSISITWLGGRTQSPERVVGMHFFNPVPVMKLVEVVRGMATSDEVVETVLKLAEDLGKVPVQVHDMPGFVSNRVLMPMINEAVFCLQEGVAEKEDIDRVMKLGMAHPMGPLELADLIGVDVVLNILEVLHRELGEDKYRPCPLLRRMAAAGRLGRKTGEGFYPYPPR